MDTFTASALAPARSRWADNVSVEVVDSYLLVSGDWQRFTRQDLLLAYERTDPRPHIQFANCRTTDDLITFVRGLGPIAARCARDIAFEELPNPYLVTLDAVIRDPSVPPSDAMDQAYRRWKAKPQPLSLRIASQDLVELAREHEIFQAMVKLTNMLLSQPAALNSKLQPRRSADRNTKHEIQGTDAKELIGLVETIATGTKHWTKQRTREVEQLRMGTTHVMPEWNWDDDNQKELNRLAKSVREGVAASSANKSSWAAFQHDPWRSARNAVTLVLCGFPLEPLWTREGLIEVPPYHMLHGIRPLLFAMLRRDIVRQRGIRVCNRPGCGNFFVVARPDKYSCSNECSAKVAANKRYIQKVKPARDEARKARSAEQTISRHPRKRG
jgi:hypothetical protein